MATLTLFTTPEKTTHNSHKFGFTLSPTNYGYWKAMIRPFLVTNNLYGYIDGTIPCPAPSLPADSSAKDGTATSQPNPQYPIWISNDAHVRLILISTISEASFQHVQGTTSKDLWLALERAYAPHTSSREYTLKTQLLKITMKDNETSSAYLTRAQEYADALANIGEPVKEKYLVMLVISGLRDEYNGLKSNILARQFPTAFTDLHSLLSDHDFMIRKTAPEVPPIQAYTATTSARTPAAAASGSAAPPTEALHALHQLAAQLGVQIQPISQSAPQAFYTNRTASSRGRGSNLRRGGRGFSNNNRMQGGANRGQFGWASNQNTVYGTCNRCGIGHVPSQCPNRDPATIRVRQPSANYADHRSQSTAWLPDTGSNYHATPDLSGLDTATSYNGEDSLHVGNGKGLPILHAGNSHFYSPTKTFSLNHVLHVPEIKKKSPFRTEVLS